MRAPEPALAQDWAAIAVRWNDLQALATELCALADLAVKADDADRPAFPELLDKASRWQRNLAADALEDIDAMMRPGLTALRTISARGADASAPALALWCEFHAAREAVLAMLANAPIALSTDEALDHA